MAQSFGARYLLAGGAPVRYEPVRQHDWSLNIYAAGGTGGTGGAVDDIPLTAQKVKIPNYKGEKGTIKHVNEITNYLLRPEPGEITATILDTIHPNSLTALWDWWNLGYNVGDDNKMASMGFASVYKRTLEIIQFDLAGVNVRTWRAEGVFLLDPPEHAEDLDYNESKHLTLSLRMSCDRIFMLDPVA